jgi:hypothetical protein
MFPQPALGDRQLERSAVFGRAGSGPQERQIDLLDVDPAVLDRLDRVGYLQQLAGGGFRIRVGAFSGKLQRYIPSLPLARPPGGWRVAGGNLGRSQRDEMAALERVASNV